MKSEHLASMPPRAEEPAAPVRQEHVGSKRGTVTRRAKEPTAKVQRSSSWRGFKITGNGDVLWKCQHHACFMQAFTFRKLSDDELSTGYQRTDSDKNYFGKPGEGFCLHKCPQCDKWFCGVHKNQHDCSGTAAAAPQHEVC